MTLSTPSIPLAYPWANETLTIHVNSNAQVIKNWSQALGLFWGQWNPQFHGNFIKTGRQGVTFNDPQHPTKEFIQVILYIPTSCPGLKHISQITLNHSRTGVKNIPLSRLHYNNNPLERQNTSVKVQGMLWQQAKANLHVASKAPYPTFAVAMSTALATAISSLLFFIKQGQWHHSPPPPLLVRTDLFI